MRILSAVASLPRRRETRIRPATVRDVQLLAVHKSIEITHGYIDGDARAEALGYVPLRLALPPAAPCRRRAGENMAETPDRPRVNIGANVLSINAASRGTPLALRR